MSAVALHGRKPSMDLKLPPALDRRFEAVVFDWDGTAVPDRSADATELRELVEELCALGLDLDRDHRHARRQRRRAACARGRQGRDASTSASTAAPRSSRRTSEGSSCSIGGRRRRRRTPRSTRPRRRRVGRARRSRRRRRDRLATTEPAQDRPDSRAGVGRSAEGADRRAARGRAGASARRPGSTVSATRSTLALAAARPAGLADPRVTSDAKHVEIGLTDKADSAALGLRRACASRHRARPRARSPVTSSGRSAGCRAATPSCSCPEARARDGDLGRRRAEWRTGGRSSRSAAARSASCALLADQLERRRRGDVPERRRRPGLDARRRRARPAARACARVAAHARRRSARDARRAALRPPGARARRAVLAGVYDGEGRDSELAPCPDWTRARARRHRSARASARRLDLATGLLREDGAVTSLRFSSLARPGTVALRAQRATARSPALAGRRTRRAAGRGGRCATGAGDRPSSASARTTPIRSGAQSGARRRGAGGLRAAASRAPGGVGAAAGRRPTSSSKATTSCSGRFASRSST